MSRITKDFRANFADRANNRVNQGADYFRSKVKINKQFARQGAVPFWRKHVLLIAFLAIGMYIAFMVCCEDGNAQEPTPTQTATAVQWTPTPTATFIPTPTPTVTPSFIPTPINENSEYVGGSTMHIFCAPINYRDPAHQLHRMDLESVVQSVKDGKAEYALTKLQNRAKIVADSTKDFFEYSDSEYPEQRVTWSLISTKWDSKEEPAKTAAEFTQQKSPTGKAFKSTGDLCFDVGENYSRFFVAIPYGATIGQIEFEVHCEGGLTLKQDKEIIECTDATGKSKFKIYPPKLAYADFGIVRDYQGKHSLVDLGKGIFRYIKDVIVTDPLAVYADADIYYSGSEDGKLYKLGANSASQAAWDIAHDAATASDFYTGSPMYATTTVYGLDPKNWEFLRGFIDCDTSGISDDTTNVIILSASASVVAKIDDSYSGDGANIHYQVGTQGATLTTADYQAFTGNSLGYFVPTSSYVRYFTSISTAVINRTGHTTLALRSANDYSDTLAEGGAVIYTSEQTGTDNDPYISVQVATVTPTPTPTATPTPTNTPISKKGFMPLVERILTPLPGE
jgi:hypothetical protein